MRLQALEYEKKEGIPGKYQEFIDSTEGKFTHPDIMALAREIDRERALFAEATSDSNGETYTVVDEVICKSDSSDEPPAPDSTDKGKK